MYYKTIPRNFHTHTIYCGHAVGLPIDYLDAINTYSLNTLGFSEHAYIDIQSFTHTVKTNEHMHMYYNDVVELKKKTNCEVLIGLEVDYFPSFMDYYKELHKKYDYLTLSVHFVIFKGLYSYGSRFESFEEMKNVVSSSVSLIRIVSAVSKFVAQI